MYKKNKSSKNKKGGVMPYYGPVTYSPINPYYNDPFYSPLTDSPIISIDVAVPVVFSDRFIKPWVPSVTYPIYYNKPNDLNQDPVMRKKIVKYFKNIMLDKWLYNESRDILNYLKVNNGKVDFLSNLSEYNPRNVDKDSSVDTENKIKFIEKYVLSDNTLLRLLSRYVNESTVSWVNLPKNKYYIRKLMEEKLYKMIKYAISENRS
ncbi:hypothetical protein Hokovirus_3_100 [Hokovirus HKV1]|uniref:Uncharacterized protein n=1 Tax=Hokovirus HKV1 TaxID=1977638 RepID=A0A1V0SGI4_9VIRU|nr:hypothetical protein Hokovirus_3_100 [Hokovirus HKV1]